MSRDVDALRKQITRLKIENSDLIEKMQAMHKALQYAVKYGCCCTEYHTCDPHRALADLPAWVRETK